eukprot:CAMPEP_0204445644 /NCGR_PEP_ID=MMETSP0470-20130426/93264_1 /ASSEMBLY_ACC=CAM_ASM_000385 /TAXON_ID=2969 /ORGANISM="Oxyrrhis marina" /LENGTH=48 /DNA_ID= /DNA_START= /DNA_END= /DNA_ORIENTATION=
MQSLRETRSNKPIERTGSDNELPVVRGDKGLPGATRSKNELPAASVPG